MYRRDCPCREAGGHFVWSVYRKELSFVERLSSLFTYCILYVCMSSYRCTHRNPGLDKEHMMSQCH